MTQWIKDPLLSPKWPELDPLLGELPNATGRVCKPRTLLASYFIYFWFCCRLISGSHFGSKEVSSLNAAESRRVLNPESLVSVFLLGGPSPWRAFSFQGATRSFKSVLGSKSPRVGSVGEGLEEAFPYSRALEQSR